MRRNLETKNRHNSQSKFRTNSETIIEEIHKASENITKKSKNLLCSSSGGVIISCSILYSSSKTLGHSHDVVIFSVSCHFNNTVPQRFAQTATNLAGNNTNHAFRTIPWQKPENFSFFKNSSMDSFRNFSRDTSKNSSRF